MANKIKRVIIFCLLVLFIFIIRNNIIFAHNYLIADFDDGVAPNIHGGFYSIYAEGNITPRHVKNPSYGNNGYSLELRFEATKEYDLWINLQADGVPFNIAEYNYLSFWIKGSKGGEVIEVQFENNLPDWDRVQIQNFIPGGILSGEWQKVVIPIKTFREGGFNRTNVKTIHFLGGKIESASSSGTIYLDDVLLGTGIGTHYLDNMETYEMGPPYNKAFDYTAYSSDTHFDEANGGALATGTNTLITDQEAFQGKGSYKIKHIRPIGGDANCNWVLNWDNRVDLTECDKLVFAIKGVKNFASGQGPRVYLDTEGWNNYVQMKAVSTYWQEHEYSLSEFAGVGFNKTKIRRLRLHSRDETALTNEFWIDEIRFIDSIAPKTTPYNLKANGEMLFNNFMFKSSNIITVEADSETTDYSIEGVKLEYSIDGGTTWVISDVDYNISASKIIYTNTFNINNLPRSSIFQIRASAMDSSGNDTCSIIRTITPYKFSAQWSFNPFSPNGDSRMETSTLSVLLSEKVKTIRVFIYNINGELIKELPKGEDSIVYEFLWDGTDYNNKVVSIGSYIYQIKYDDKGYNGVIVLVK